MKNRTDTSVIEETGKLLLSSDLGFTKTATTAYENFGADITATTTADTTFNIEVKGLERFRYCYSGETFRVSEEVFGNGHIQILNKSTKNDLGRSKWHKFLDGDYDALCYLHIPTGTLYYLTREQVVKTAYKGEAYMLQRHTKYCEDKTVSWEKKAVLDLDKAKVICKDL